MISTFAPIGMLDLGSIWALTPSVKAGLAFALTFFRQLQTSFHAMKLSLLHFMPKKQANKQTKHTSFLSLWVGQRTSFLSSSSFMFCFFIHPTQVPVCYQGPMRLERITLEDFGSILIQMTLLHRIGGAHSFVLLFLSFFLFGRLFLHQCFK